MTASLLLLLLVGTPSTAQPPVREDQVLATRHLELTQEGEAVVSLAPQQPTTLVFNTPLLPDGVKVEDTSLVILAVNEHRGLLTLLPSDTWLPGRSLSLKVRFADGALPESAIIRLEVVPSGAAHEVRVYRRPRSGESHQHEARQQRERAEQCEARLAHVQVRSSISEEGAGLASILDTGLARGGHGIMARDISKSTLQDKEETLRKRKAFSYRAGAVDRVAVELWLENTGTTSVDLQEATLETTEGTPLRVLRVWPREPLPPGETRRLLVEAEATEAQSRGTFQLGLGDADGPYGLVLHGVTFP